MRILLIAGLMIWSGAVHAQETTLATVLEVRYGEVELKRVNTEEWLAVSMGAIMPFGEGDSLRTGDRGRASLSFANDGEILLLPASTLFLETYRHDLTTDGEIVRFRASLEGVMVQRWAAPQSDYVLTLDDPDTAVVAPAPLSAMWAIPDLPDTVAVASRSADVQAQGEVYTVEAGQAIWLDTTPTLATLGEPLNAARLEARINGCDALVTTAGLNGVNVRRGIGQLNEKLGLIPDGATVRAMAINASRYWIRIQYLSAFSWIVLDALELDCPDLTVLSDQTPPERLLAAVNVLDGEISLLQPFFGLPPEDSFFYLLVP